MKKIFCLLFVSIFIFFAIPKSSEAYTITDIWSTQDALVTPYEYSYLYKNAGIAAYVYTDYNINLDQDLPSTFKLVKKDKTFIIVRHWLSKNLIMVTEKGLIVSYYPKFNSPLNNVVSPSVDSDNGGKHILNTLNDAAKVFINTSISKAAMLNFEHLEDNHLFMVNPKTNAKITFPSDAEISTVAAVSYFPNVKIINPIVFTPGITQNVKFTASNLNDVKNNLNSAIAYYFISYKASTPLEFDNLEMCCSFRYNAYELNNNFTPIFKDVKTSDWFHNDVSWAVLRGMIQGYEDGTFLPTKKLTESQLISLLTKYYNINTMANSNEYNMLNAYSYFNQFISLNGWKNPGKRNEPITRGKVAQLLSVTTGGPSDQEGAIRYLMQKNITTVKTVKEFNANNHINRSQISAFFIRMHDMGLDTITK